MIPPTDGGPAFPNIWEDNPSQGMSLRDWWAGLAMQGMMSNHAMMEALGLVAQVQGKTMREVLTAKAFEAADAMLAKRRRTE